MAEIVRLCYKMLTDLRQEMLLSHINRVLPDTTHCVLGIGEASSFLPDEQRHTPRCRSCRAPLGTSAAKAGLRGAEHRGKGRGRKTS